MSITPEERDYQAALSAIHVQVRAIQVLPQTDKFTLKQDVDRIIEGVYDDATARRLAEQFSAGHRKCRHTGGYQTLAGRTVCVYCGDEVEL